MHSCRLVAGLIGIFAHLPFAGVSTAEPWKGGISALTGIHLHAPSATIHLGAALVVAPGFLWVYTVSVSTGSFKPGGAPECVERTSSSAKCLRQLVAYWLPLPAIPGCVLHDEETPKVPVLKPRLNEDIFGNGKFALVGCCPPRFPVDVHLHWNASLNLALSLSGVVSTGMPSDPVLGRDILCANSKLDNIRVVLQFQVAHRSIGSYAHTDCFPNSLVNPKQISPVCDGRQRLRAVSFRLAPFCHALGRRLNNVKRNTATAR
eukprot:556256-Amphidinium_carterae.1